jgi:PAS domain S-box-containing protein
LSIVSRFRLDDAVRLVVSGWGKLVQLICSWNPKRIFLVLFLSAIALSVALQGLVGVRILSPEWQLAIETLLFSGIALVLFLVLRRYERMRTDALASLKIALRAQAAQARAQAEIFAHMLDGFGLHEIICDAAGQPIDYRFLQVNPAFEQLTGLRAADIVGKTARQVLPTLEPSWIEIYGKVALGDGPAHFEQYSQPLDRYYEVTAFSPERGKFVTFFDDITTRRHAEDALREREERFRRIFDQGPLGIALTDLQTRLMDVNPTMCEMLGYTADELRGRSFVDLTHPDDIAANMETWNRFVRGEIGSYRLEKRYLRKDGSILWAILQSTAIRDRAGNVLYMLSMIQDITPQKKSLLELAENEERFRVISDLTSDYAYTLEISEHGRIERVWNFGPLTRITGYTEAELDALGGWQALVHPDDLAATQASMHRVLQGHSDASEYRIITRERAVRWVREYIRPLRDESSGRVTKLFGAIQDITERKRVEQAEREQRQLAEALRDTAALLNSTLHLDRVIGRALANLGRIIPHQAANIMLISGDTARVVGSHGYESRIANLELDLRQMRIMRQAVRQERPVLIQDTQADPDWVNLPESSWVRSHICAPIRLRKEIVGLLNIDSPIANFFTEAALGRLQAFTDQLAIAIDNARLLEATQHHAAQLEIVYEAGLALNRVLEPQVQIENLLTNAKRVVDAQRAEFFTLNAQAQRLEYHLSCGYDESVNHRAREELVFSFDDVQQPAVQAILTQKTIYLANTQTNPHWIPLDPSLRSGIWIPIRRQNALRGVLGVLADRVNAFTRADEQLLELLANQAAVSMDNGELLAETHRRLRALDAINTISTALRAANTQQEIAQSVLEGTLAVLNARDGQIAFYSDDKKNLRVSAARGWFAHTPAIAPADDGIAGSVLRTNQTYLVRDFRSDPSTSEMARDAIPENYSGAILPVQNIQEPIGVLAIAVPHPRTLEPQEISLLTTLAEIAGNAIARAMSHEQLERRVRQLAALRAIDVAITASTDLQVTLEVLLAQTLAQLDMDAGAVLTFHPTLQTLEYAAGRGFYTSALKYTRLRLGQGYAGRVALQRQVIVVPDLNNNLDGLAQATYLKDENFVSYAAVPLVAQGTLRGVLELFKRTPLHADAEWLDFVQAIGAQAAISIDNAELFRNLQVKNLELALAYDETIEGWSRALDLRDKETEGHTRRVTQMTEQLARAMGVPEDELVHIRRGSLLHDIGKMGIPDHILYKPDKLTDAEWKVMRTHPQLAFDMLVPIAYLRPALDIPYCHHERWDGTGYPRQLKGKEIPLAARIFAVVDSWDALRSDRPYRKGWTDAQVRAYIQEQAGKAFDPEIVKIFLQLI